jgi:hypothetical protein
MQNPSDDPCFLLEHGERGLEQSLERHHLRAEKDSGTNPTSELFDARDQRVDLRRSIVAARSDVCEPDSARAGHDARRWAHTMEIDLMTFGN